MEKRTVIKIFAGSPSDADDERDKGVAEVIARLNKGVAKGKGYVFELKTWKDIIPDVSDRAQALIFEQIGKFDIFIGIMRFRFGKPTGKYESGTEEEFYYAYQKWEEENKPRRILFYFDQNFSGTLDKMDLDELARVKTFKKKVQSQGVTKDFNGYQDFINLLQDHLTDIVLNWSQQKTPSHQSALGMNQTDEKQEITIEYQPCWQQAFINQRSPNERTEAFLFKKAKSSIKFMTISGRSIFNTPVEKFLNEKNKGFADFTFKLLLFDWNSPWIGMKMRDERRVTPEEIDQARRKAIIITKEFLNYTRTNINMQIKLHSEYPIWRMLILDEALLYSGYYPKGKRGYEGPMYVFDREDNSSLFVPMNQYFDMLWRSSGTILNNDPEDSRFDLIPLNELIEPHEHS